MRLCLLHCSITITAQVKCVCTSTMAICKQYSAGEVGRLSKHEIYWAFSGRIHFYEFPYNTYISWPLFNAVKCSIASTELCKRVVCLQTASCRGTHRIFQHSLHCGKSSHRHFCFKLVNLYLLYEIRNRVWRDCKQSSINKSCFLLKTFKNFALWKILHDCVQPSNVAITPPEEI